MSPCLGSLLARWYGWIGFRNTTELALSAFLGLWFIIALLILKNFPNYSIISSSLVSQECLSPRLQIELFQLVSEALLYCNVFGMSLF
jgi:hypothetical protein